MKSAATVAERTKSQVVQVIGKNRPLQGKAEGSCKKRSSFPNGKGGKNCLNWRNPLMNTGKETRSHTLRRRKGTEEWALWEEPSIPCIWGICSWQKMPTPCFRWIEGILFIPSGCSYMKDQTEILDGATRLHMTRLSIADNPHFSLSPSMEIDRGGYTYTCQTLEQLGEENPETDYYFILGADSLFQMESWEGS